MSRDKVLWGVPPWGGPSIKIEAGTRSAYERRQREGWTHLEIHYCKAACCAQG